VFIGRKLRQLREFFKSKNIMLLARHLENRSATISCTITIQWFAHRSNHQPGTATKWSGKLA
jgi:hypothetical protein